MTEMRCAIRICSDTTICVTCGREWDTGDFIAESACPYYDDRPMPWWIHVGIVGAMIGLAFLGGLIVTKILP